MSDRPGGPRGLLAPAWGNHGPVRCVATTRLGGLGVAPFATLNLGGRTADRADTVRANRRRLRAALALPSEPRWLRQVHGTSVVHAGSAASLPEADAVWIDQPGQVCAVLTADCLPVVLTDVRGACVGIAHAGWRGLSAGVLEATVDALPSEPDQLLGWLGPAIGPRAFEVGDTVRDAFLEADPGARSAFHSSASGRWNADLYGLARQRLRRAGVRRIEGGGWCTYSEARRFFSHRRDGPDTGRMATLAWLAAEE